MSPCTLDPVAASAVGIQCCGAIRADHPKILEAVVVANAVDVIEDHRHRPAAPHLALPAQLALRLLQTLRKKAVLEVVS
jgi:hypothetical protein